MEPVHVPTSQTIVASLRALLPQLPATFAAGLVYGSVARGRHHLGSDVDALLISSSAVAAADRATVFASYSKFEINLGLRPDPAYPVELFTADECRSLLGLAIRQPTDISGSSGRRLTFDDAWELLYALTTPHLVVTGEDLIAQLRAGARRRLEQLRDRETSGRPAERTR